MFILTHITVLSYAINNSLFSLWIIEYPDDFDLAETLISTCFPHCRRAVFRPFICCRKAASGHSATAGRLSSILSTDLDEYHRPPPPCLLEIGGESCHPTPVYQLLLVTSVNGPKIISSQTNTGDSC